MVNMGSLSSRTIKVVSPDVNQEKMIAQNIISLQDAEMDARALKAVRVAVEKAQFCKKPIARYDVTSKRTYIEYADGEKKYVDE